MEYKKILFIMLIFSLFCFSLNSIFAENFTDTVMCDEMDSNSGELSVYSDSIDDDSEELLSNSNQDIISEQSSDPLPNVDKGSVSGGVDFVNVHPWAPSDSVNGNKGNITYNIPSEASNIKSAFVYVNVYSGSGGTNYGSYANISIKTENNSSNHFEKLYSSTSSKDGVNYIINDHIVRCYSDYMIFYNVTDLLQGLNGTSVSIDVLSYPMSGLSFDGRIKLISLFVAWDDGDSDEIDYWINAGQAWTDSQLSHSFDLSDVNLDEVNASLINVALSSEDAMYYISSLPFFSENEDDVYVSGAYYQYHKWDITNYLENPLEIKYKAVGGAYGPSFKNVISILTIQQPKVNIEFIQANASLKVSDNDKNIVYPGFKNSLNVHINVNTAGKYTINLLAKDKIVNSTVYNLIVGENNFDLVDSTIRTSDFPKYVGSSESYDKVNYKVQVLFRGKIINETSCETTVLYNGYLAKDTYNELSLEPFYMGDISGDIVILTNGSYVESSIVNAVGNFAVDLTNQSSIVKAFIYVSYSLASEGNDNVNMFNVTFNGYKINPIFFARDQDNLASNCGCGLIVYDVTEHILNGNNVLDLNKTIRAAVYPISLVYMFNSTDSDIVKRIYISNGADLLGDYGGNSIPIKVDSNIEVNSSNVSDAMVYIFANGAVDGRGIIVVNGNTYEHPWNGTNESTEIFAKNIASIVKDDNSFSVILNSGSFTLLQHILVLTKNVPGEDNPKNETPIEKISTKINAPTVTTVYNNNKNLIITLKDVNGNVISCADIIVVFNGVRKVIATNTKGQVTLKIQGNLIPKTYIASITYAGNKFYLKSTFNAKVVVKKANVKLTAKKKTFKSKIKIKKYAVTLKNNKGKPMNKVKLLLKVKGKTFKATTNKKGKATFKIKKLTKKSKYDAKVFYNGDKYFNKLTKKVKIIIKK